MSITVPLRFKMTSIWAPGRVGGHPAKRRLRARRRLVAFLQSEAAFVASRRSLPSNGGRPCKHRPHCTRCKEGIIYAARCSNCPEQTHLKAALPSSRSDKRRRGEKRSETASQCARTRPMRKPYVARSLAKAPSRSSLAKAPSIVLSTCAAPRRSPRSSSCRLPAASGCSP